MKHAREAAHRFSDAQVSNEHVWQTRRNVTDAARSTQLGSCQLFDPPNIIMILIKIEEPTTSHRQRAFVSFFSIQVIRTGSHVVISSSNLENSKSCFHGRYPAANVVSSPIFATCQTARVVSSRTETCNQSAFCSCPTTPLIGM